MSASAAPRLLDWDCAFFGARIASLPLETRSERDLEAALEWCRRERVDCLYALSDEHDGPKRAWLEAKGARLVDERTTLSTPLVQRRTGSALDAVRPARAEDVPLMQAVAAEAHRDSRFWNDPRFPRERCAALYATWIAGEAQGRAAAVFVRDGPRATSVATSVAPPRRVTGTSASWPWRKPRAVAASAADWSTPRFPGPRRADCPAWRS